MRFKYTIVLDKRRKLQSGKYPIKVNILSYADNKNHYVSIQRLFTASGKIEISCENQKEFDSVWTNRHKKDSFGNEMANLETYKRLLEVYYKNTENFDLEFSFVGSGLAKIKKKTDNELNGSFKVPSRYFSIRNLIKKIIK